MLPNDDRLSGVYLKIERAKKHISDIEVANNAFSEANRDAFQVDNDANTGDEVYRVAFREQIPRDLPLVIGDAIHNLRHCKRIKYPS
jgi:hypothetical protein